MNIPPPPKFPHPRVIRDGCGVFCKVCNSTTPRSGFLGLFGKRICDNEECETNKNLIMEIENKVNDKYDYIIISEPELLFKKRIEYFQNLGYSQDSNILVEKIDKTIMFTCVMKMLIYKS